MNEDKTTQHHTDESRRAFLKKVSYVPPVIVTLAVAPTKYAFGSVQSGNDTPVIPPPGEQG